jgi:hypothetical protein
MKKNIMIYSKEHELFLCEFLGNFRVGHYLFEKMELLYNKYLPDEIDEETEDVFNNACNSFYLDEEVCPSIGDCICFSVINSDCDLANDIIKILTFRFDLIITHKKYIDGEICFYAKIINEYEENPWREITEPKIF